jgi:hypothetical protein
MNLRKKAINPMVDWVRLIGPTIAQLTRH